MAVLTTRGLVEGTERVVPDAGGRRGPRVPIVTGGASGIGLATGPVRGGNVGRNT
jgi:hypothetical protein